MFLCTIQKPNQALIEIQSQSLGDLNHDGFGDIAVGAPFQDLTGVVYILFLGLGT